MPECYQLSRTLLGQRWLTQIKQAFFLLSSPASDSYWEMGLETLGKKLIVFLVSPHYQDLKIIRRLIRNEQTLITWLGKFSWIKGTPTNSLQRWKKDRKAKNWKTFWSGHLQHLLCSPLFTDFLEEYLGSLPGCVREVDNGRCMDTARPLQEPRVNTPRYQMEPLYTPL